MRGVSKNNEARVYVRILEKVEKRREKFILLSMFDCADIDTALFSRSEPHRALYIGKLVLKWVG
jgi:hypothetical protein